MGYYIQTDDRFGKADYIKEHYHAVELEARPARFEDVPENMALVVVVENVGLFEAAGFVYNAREFDHFFSPNDDRPMRYLLMARGMAEELSGYTKNPPWDAR